MSLIFGKRSSKLGKVGSSVVLSGAVLNSALVSTGEVGAVKSLSYYMNQCWFLRFLVNLFYSVPFFSDPFQKVFCVPKKNDSYKVPEDFYNLLVNYEGRTICMPRYLVENIINEESRKRFEEMLKKDDDLVGSNGSIFVRLIKISEDGCLNLQLEDYGEDNDILVTQYAGPDSNKIKELCKYFDSVTNLESYKNYYGEFERVFFLKEGVSDERLEKCVGRFFMIGVNELYSIVPPSFRWKLNKVLDVEGINKNQDKDGKVRIRVESVDEKCSALGILLGDDCFVWTKGLTGNKGAVDNFLEYFQQNSDCSDKFKENCGVFEKAFSSTEGVVSDERLNWCVGKTLEVGIDELYKIISPQQKYILDDLLSRKNVNKNNEVKARIHVRAVDSSYSFLGISVNILGDGCFVRTKRLTNDRKALNNFFEYFQQNCEDSYIFRDYCDYMDYIENIIFGV